MKTKLLPAILLLSLLTATGIFSPGLALSPAAAAKTGKTGLPVPRFVSLRSDKVNLRQGPRKDYPVKWVFNRLQLPVEIIAEYENWRKIRDSQGTEGWVFYRLLTGRRTALVQPWEKNNTPLSVRQDKSEKSAVTARVEPGVQVLINSCNGKWCEIAVSGFNGWIAQHRLWGVYAGEIIKK